MTHNGHHYFIANHDHLWNASQHKHIHTHTYKYLYISIQSAEIEASHNLKSI